MRMSSLLLPAAAVLLLSCGGSTPPEGPKFAELPTQPGAEDGESGSEPEPADEPASPEAPKTWADMDHEARVAFMKETVTPRMKALFQEFDAKEFEKFGCPTCHGPGVKDGKFDMPTTSLDVLDPTNDFAKHQKKYAKQLAFMKTKVVPEMAQLLGKSVYDPKTQQGFGCFNCHTMAGKK